MKDVRNKSLRPISTPEVDQGTAVVTPKAPEKKAIQAPTTTRQAGLQGAAQAQDKGAKVGSAKVRGDAKISEHAFSMPPDELSALLAKEIYGAFEFAATLKDGMTAFGGARVTPGSEAFDVGKRWGESLLLSNLFALSPQHALKALSSGQFSEDAAQGALGAAMGIEVGLVGATEYGKALAAVGGLSSPDALVAANLLAHASDKSGAERVQRSVIRSGAGPGIMEAVAIGYVEAREKIQKLLPDLPKEMLEDLITQGSRIVLPFEQATSKYIEKLQNFVHFLPRRLALTEQASSFLAFVGGFGTLNELFEVWRTGQPVLLDGTKFWKPMIDALKDGWKAYGLVPDQLSDRVMVKDGAAAGLPSVTAAALDAVEQPKPSLERATEMANDIVRGLATLAHVPTAVTILGGRELRADDKSLAIGRMLVEGLTKNHTPIRLGGDGTLLESVAAAVKKADPSANVQAVLYDHGHLDAEAVKQKADVFEVVHSAPAHKVLLYENTSGFVVHPGGVGTFDELWEIACLMQTGKIPRRPLLLVDGEPSFWPRILDEMYLAMAKGDQKTIAADDMKLFTVVKPEGQVTAEDKNKPYQVRDPRSALAELRLTLSEQKAESV
ncbi:MAG: LOG family protein [Myxococcota bacterium]